MIIQYHHHYHLYFFLSSVAWLNHIKYYFYCNTIDRLSLWIIYKFHVISIIISSVYIYSKKKTKKKSRGGIGQRGEKVRLPLTWSSSLSSVLHCCSNCSTLSTSTRLTLSFTFFWEVSTSPGPCPSSSASSLALLSCCWLVDSFSRTASKSARASVRFS